MQAAIRRLAIMRSAHAADRLTAGDDLTGRHEWHNRLVLGADAVAMGDHDDASARDPAGKAHASGRRREHQRPARGAEIDAPMPGGVRRRRWSEPAQDDDRARYRCAISRVQGGAHDGWRAG